MARLLSPDDVSNLLSSWPAGLHKMTETIPEHILDLCDRLTYSHIVDKFDKVHDGVGSLDSLSEKYFWRSMTLWAEFGSSWYNAIDLSILLGVHHVVIASWIERHGIDWLSLLRRKVGFRARDQAKYTIFLDTYGRFHTEVTFNYVYLNSIQSIRSRVRAGMAVIPNRTLEAADLALSRERKISNPVSHADYGSYMFARCLRRVKLYEDTRNR